MNKQLPKRELDKRQLLKYLWAIAVSGLIIAQVMIDKENKYLPLIHRALDILQQQNPTVPLMDSPINGK